MIMRTLSMAFATNWGLVVSVLAGRALLLWGPC